MTQEELIQLIKDVGFNHSNALKELYWMLKRFKFEPYALEWIAKEVSIAMSEAQRGKTIKEAEGIK